MGGSSSKSASTTTNNTNTSNLALDGVEGLVLSNATGNDVNFEVTDGRAFETVTRALQSVDDATAAALSSLADSGTQNLDALSKNTLASLEKINDSNQSEQAALIDKISTTVIAGAVIMGAVTIWKGR